MRTNRLLLLAYLLLGACVLAAGCVSDTVAPPDDEAPILPPEHVTANVSQSEKVVLNWDPNPHPMLAGYLVYRVETTSQHVAKLTKSPLLTTSFQDMGARRGVLYEYRVTAVTKSGKESIYTAIAILLDASIDVQIPNREL